MYTQLMHTVSFEKCRKVILCLGQITFESVLRSLRSDEIPRIESYRDFLRSGCNPLILVTETGHSFAIYALAHCGCLSVSFPGKYLLAFGLCFSFFRILLNRPGSIAAGQTSAADIFTEISCITAQFMLYLIHC